MDAKSTGSSSCLCQSWTYQRRHHNLEVKVSVPQSNSIISSENGNQIWLNESPDLDDSDTTDQDSIQLPPTEETTMGHRTTSSRILYEVSENHKELLNNFEHLSFCQRSPHLQARKCSLPANIIAECSVHIPPPRVPQKNPLPEMLSHVALEKFARCRRNRVPRITYSQHNDTCTVTSVRERPIYPSLPFSPFCSPNSSPNLLRERESAKSSYQTAPIHTKLNQYRVMGEIGRGSFGVVKLAFNEDDNTHYAMKILSKKKLMRRAGLYGRMPPPREGQKLRSSPLDQIYREIAILKKLNHPNVVKLFDVLNDPESDNLYMVFELLQQGPVVFLPTKNPISEVKSWQYFRDIVMGIEYLHFQKIIHRDIKPSNLLLTDDGRIQISDFGVCNQFEGVDAFLSDTSGTPAFVAPEALKGTRTTYSGKALDIWQMGISLYSFVYGHLPYDDSNILALYTRIRSEPLPFPPERLISDSLKSLLKKMLEKDPSYRIKLGDIKSHPWVTRNDLCPLPEEKENCSRIEVTDDEINNCIRSVPKLDTLVLIKSMLKKHSFCHPYKDSNNMSSDRLLPERRLDRRTSSEKALPALLEVSSTNP